MSKILPPQGTRDFNAITIHKRNYIFNTIRSVFELYGFQPLETPAMEYLDTLMGKYGDEGDKLIFKILNSGDFSTSTRNRVSKVLDALFQIQQKEKLDSENKLTYTMKDLIVANFDIRKVKEIIEESLQPKELSNEVVEKALRYDLTIPFARYVAANHTQLTMPFKRYQIQPVWRADRPQKGRYREFYQCDVDIVGSNSLLNEVELANIYIEVLNKLQITNYELRINSRKILVALAEMCGGTNKLIDITIAIDKLEKIGLEKVKVELAQRGLSDKQINIIQTYLSISGSNIEKLNALTQLLGENEMGKKGMEEIKYILSFTNSQSPITIDFTLVRGLNYYTGIIFEVAVTNVQIGSIGGGGRYDNLTNLFGVPNISGVGISFGVDRIYDVMEELKLFPHNMYTHTQVLFFNLGEVESRSAFTLMQALRKTGVRCELYHEQAKFDKQFKYAEKKNIPHIVIIGSKEINENTCVVKTLATGKQQAITQNKLVDFFLQLVQ